MKDIGERSAGNPPAAFDEGRQEKSRRLLYQGSMVALKITERSHRLKDVFSK